MFNHSNNKNDNKYDKRINISKATLMVVLVLPSKLVQNEAASNTPCKKNNGDFDAPRLIIERL